MNSIIIKDTSIRMKDGYFSLTDIAKTTSRPSDEVLRGWLRNSDTLEFLGEWESLHNEDFKPVQMDGLKLKALKRSEYISVSKYVTETNAIGIFYQKGRAGGTYAHIEIALDFAAWIEPKFKVYLFKEWVRMKNEEINQSLNWYSQMLGRSAEQIQIFANSLPLITKSLDSENKDE